MENLQRVKFNFNSIFPHLTHLTQVIQVLCSGNNTIDFVKRK